MEQLVIFLDFDDVLNNKYSEMEVIETEEGFPLPFFDNKNLTNCRKSPPYFVA